MSVALFPGQFYVYINGLSEFGKYNIYWYVSGHRIDNLILKKDWIYSART